MASRVKAIVAGELTMKVSIWQQFSSNHSGFFWVVGTFNTTDDADRAFNEIREMLFEIDRWHRDNHDYRSNQQYNDGLEVFPPEKEFAEKYQVEWLNPIDWTGWASYQYQLESFDAQKAAKALIDDAVTIVGRNVIVSNPHQTWMTVQPFKGILDSLGAQTIGYDLELTESDKILVTLHTRIRFAAPDEKIADSIEQAIKTYLDGELDSINNPPPWKDDTTNYEKAFSKGSILKREHLDLILAHWQSRFLLTSGIEALKDHAKLMLIHRLGLISNKLVMRRDNLQFTLDDTWFHNQELGVCALVAWLEVKGCTDIDYAYLKELD
jgi:hypothetical protein